MESLKNALSKGMNFYNESNKIYTTIQETINKNITVREVESKYYVRIDLPGSSKNDIELNSTDNSIEVKWYRTNIKEFDCLQEDGECLFNTKGEDVYYKFNGLISDNITAKYENSVLYLIIPKRNSTVSKKQVQIK